MSAQSCFLVTHKFPSLSGNQTGHIIPGKQRMERGLGAGVTTYVWAGEGVCVPMLHLE